MLKKNFLLKEEFKTIEEIRIPCPKCNQGNMVANGKELVSRNTKFTFDSKGHDSFDHAWIFDNFAAVILCNNCNNTASICGETSIHEETVGWDDERDGFIKEYSTIFKIVFFYPPLQIISLPESCPKEIKAIFKQSFSLFWVDLDSCANKLRIALEHLMDDKKVRKTQLTKKGKRMKFTLHKRIDLYFSQKYPELAKLLLAVKWIGNEGSHVGGLTREDLVNAYELIEHALTEIYDSKIERLQKISKTINKTKKPLSKTKKSK